VAMAASYCVRYQISCLSLWGWRIADSIHGDGMHSSNVVIEITSVSSHRLSVLCRILALDTNYCTTAIVGQVRMLRKHADCPTLVPAF